ncbi:MAG: LysR family transcriptional regulator [Firmicutes bacterium]|nr:LysR family transcriptional regulator [Bacillota bacterium]
MDTRGLETILAIARAGSLSRAAEMLHLSQSTVSYRLELLESETGFPIIDRRRGLRRITLTPAGEKLLDIAERWELMQKEFDDMRRFGPNLSLTIASVDSLNAYIFPPVYEALARHQPPLRIRVRTQQSVECYELMERKEIDVAFVLHVRQAKGIVVEPFFTEPLVVIKRGTPTHAPYPTIRASTLDPYSELYINWNPQFAAWHDRTWGVTPVRIHLDTAHLITAFMNSPTEWAIVPLSMAQSFARTMDMAIYTLDESPPDRVAYQLRHANPKPHTEQALNILDAYLRTIQMPLTRTRANP